MRVLLLDEEQLALDGFEELLFKISDDIEVVGKYRDPLQAKEEY